MYAQARCALYENICIFANVQSEHESTNCNRISYSWWIPKALNYIHISEKMFPHNLLNTFIFIMFLKFYENSSALIVSPNFENSNGILTSLPTLNNGELTIYQSCPRGNNVSSGRPILLLIYDIFGLHPHAFHYADRVANLTGYCVLVPDFFRLKPFPTKGYPPRK